MQRLASFLQAAERRMGHKLAHINGTKGLKSMRSAASLNLERLDRQAVGTCLYLQLMGTGRLTRHNLLSLISGVQRYKIMWRTVCSSHSLHRQQQAKFLEVQHHHSLPVTTLSRQLRIASTTTQALKTCAQYGVLQQSPGWPDMLLTGSCW